MTPTIRIGVLGLEHDHVWSNLESLIQTDGAELVGFADAREDLREQARDRSGVAAFATADELITEKEMDAVYVFGSNRRGEQLSTWALEQGLHVLIEKPMAANLEGADRMLAAARKSRARLIVNWPFAWWPQLQHAIQMALAGEIGALWQVKYRAAHAGPQELGCSEHFCNWLFDPVQNGAGALMDYCCYGCVLARVLLGMPSRVTGFAARLRKEAITVDDNGLIVMEYPRALAVAEASWTQIGNLSSYVTMIYGSKGTLLVEPRAGGRLLHATEEKPDGEVVDVPEPPRRLSNSAEHFIHCLKTDSEPWLLCQDRVCRDAQEILEAGLVSCRNLSSVSIPLPLG